MSDITFDCPHCSGHLSVDEAGAGITVKCPLCSQSIVIPQVSQQTSNQMHPLQERVEKPCLFCGELILSGAVKCRYCGEFLNKRQTPPPQPIKKPDHVPTYLGQSIFVMLLCCLPFGIIATVYATQVNGKMQIGDYAGAIQASKNAHMWSTIGCVCGFIAIPVLFICMVG